MKFKKLSALIIALAMTVCVFSACNDAAEKETSGNKENTKQAQKKDNKKADGKATDASKPSDSKAKDENKAPADNAKAEDVPVDHIEKAEDIQTGDELTSLINESNDPDTDPERKEEILEILEEYLSGFEVESVTLPAE